jgi:hypothetical protein
MNGTDHPKSNDAATSRAPARRRRRTPRDGVTRKMGALSAPAGLLALCITMGAAFVWGLSGAMAQVISGIEGALTLNLVHKAALLAFPVLTPLVLVAMHRAHWRLMRPWLRRMAQAVLTIWATTTALMAWALL